uniref:Actin maturation protease n=2 Tax=Lygus hesperus TaxID=30085 RepID=A0A0A9Z061_LYGHE
MKRCSPVKITPVMDSLCIRCSPPPPLSPERMEQSRLDVTSSRPRAQLSGDPRVVQYLKFLVEEVNSKKKIWQCAETSFIMYVDIQPQLQVGPTCGLLALSLVANLVRPTTVNKLLHIAQAKGFTKQGEIFSALNMSLLAEEVLGEYCDVRLHQHDMLSCCPDSVWDLLLSHNIFLVPYDKDKDNSPGLHNGHKAHWCVIVGTSVCSGEKFYCTAQGKSRKLSLWRTDLLAASNKQLFEIQPDLMNSNYVTSNIRAELAGQCISFEFHEGITLPIVRTSDEDFPTTLTVLQQITWNPSSRA